MFLCLWLLISIHTSYELSLSNYLHFLLTKSIILLFASMHLSFCGGCRARSVCKYMQSDLILHFMLVYHYNIWISVGGLGFLRENITFIRWIEVVKGLSLYHTILTFNDIVKIIKVFENTVGKLKNCGSQHYLLFPWCSYSTTDYLIFMLTPQNIDKSKIL